MSVTRLTRTGNNFDFLRFMAASVVVIGHCFWLGGNIHREPLLNWTGYTDMADIAVNIFFIMSGFLITHSWLKKSNVLEFALKRALRIFPALIVSVLLTVLVVGSLATDRSLNEYFYNRQTLHYVSNILLMTHFHLPGVFANNPFPDTVNGSVWTLPYEVFMYACVLALGLLGALRKSTVALIWAALYLVHLVLLPEWNISSLIVQKLARLGMFFFAGALLYLLRDLIPWRGPIALFLLALVAATATHEISYYVLALTLPYLVIYLAYVRLPLVSSFGRYGDFSYGLYIFSFPIQQLIVLWLGEALTFKAFVVISYLTSLGLAIFSWHIIESPALGLKRALGRLRTSPVSVTSRAP
ncbi:peptidoglycan/LPS O-acetylase OafA/YrhL [Pseudomonas duriflava]|uniref:Peptidoglycan/LPS O-acetylase OafA/YrhL n=1 Tax=Pseudomonas duriflava TaxID=459528 RepID=A0A562PS46_9PSED|nr:acyltransferase [Pseudomonas duriflava]TWI47267.1 peptidoglycan/LPS O-acetylase OafA/YrhL [Pseudomonas duriflava]